MNGYDLLKSLNGVDLRFLQEMNEWQNHNVSLPVQPKPDVPASDETAEPWQHTEMPASCSSANTSARTPHRFWSVFHRIVMISASAACLMLTLGIIQRAVFSHRNAPDHESSADSDVTEITVQTKTTAASQTTCTSTTETTTAASTSAFTTVPTTSYTTVPLIETDITSAVTVIPLVTETAVITEVQTWQTTVTQETTVTSDTTATEIIETTFKPSITTTTSTTEEIATGILVIQQLPYQLNYTFGETLNLDGGLLQFTSVTTSGKVSISEKVPMTNENVIVDTTEFDFAMESKMAGEVRIFITFNGFTCSFKITVSDTAAITMPYQP